MKDLFTETNSNGSLYHNNILQNDCKFYDFVIKKHGDKMIIKVLLVFKDASIFLNLLLKAILNM